MAKTLSEASAEYVKLVEEAVSETGLDRMGVDFQVYNLLKTKNEVVRVQKANEIAEILTNREDLVIVAIYEKAFDRVDDKTRRMWIESALTKVSYDTEKDKLVIGGEPAITVPLGMYHKYDKLAVDMAELEQLTLQQIRDEEEEEKERKKAEKKEKKQKKF
jgi:hypothetical protein